MATTYLQNTRGTPTNAQKYTYSFWIKRCELSDGSKEAFLLDGYADASNRSKIAFQSGDQLEIWNTNSGSNTFVLNPTRKFRDVSAWYHIVLSVDTTQSTDSDRVKLYVNGVQETSLGSTTYPSQNDANNTINESGTTLSIMAYGGNASSDSYRLSSLMTHIHFTDGYAYPASTFGETDSVSGIWKPKTAPSVTYGNNGFFLKFENSGNLDLDSSGNNLSFTTSGTLTQNVDTPSNNFATMNPLDNLYFSGTFTNGNNTVVSGTNSYSYCSSTIHVSSGKYYWEIKAISPHSAMRVGIGSKIATSNSDNLGNDTDGEAVIYPSGDTKVNNVDNPNSWSGTSWTTNDILGFAMDLDNNKLYISKNGTFMNSGSPTSGSTGTGALSLTAAASTPTGAYFVAWGDNWSSGTATMSHNFGQGYFGTTQVASAGTAPSEGGIFEYDCPSGYQALCTKGINSF
jgi:hypothetical protein